MNHFHAFFLLFCFMFFAFRRTLRYLHIFQQEEYDARRFGPWLIRTKALDKKLSLSLMALVVLAFFMPTLMRCIDYFTAALFAFFAALEIDPRFDAKKKLVMTDRARRVCAGALCVSLVCSLFVLALNGKIFWIIAIQIIPISLIISNFLLGPYESSLQRRIMREAKEKLARINPQIIGITGSFGKTSVKHILGHILEMNEPTFFTPGSINTLMGISRMIREKLADNTRNFLVEMGAYGVGSIKRLCELTPPSFGIITAIGEAHYERFKTLDAVARAKFELAEAALHKQNGKVVIHQSILSQDYARSFVHNRRDKFVICGGVGADFEIVSAEQTNAGLDIRVSWGENSYALFAPLFGLHHADNIVLAFAMAVTLGVAPERTVQALRTVSQIQHRLEVKPQPDGTLYIDDGYNSNPKGFLSALGLLTKLAAEKKSRRILITPGIVELGDKHNEVHKMLGEHAALHSDVALVIRHERIPTFVEGYLSKSEHKNIHKMSSFAEAQAWLDSHRRAGDVILIENDLPDLTEARLSL